MVSTNPERSRGGSWGIVALAASAALAIGIVAGCGDDQEAVGVAEPARAAAHEHSAASPQVHTEPAHAFQDEMRKLWEDHITWTRLAIVSFLEDLPDLEATVGRLLQNQTDIGDAIKPFYGDEAGDELTRLLEGHINGAVELMTAAQSGTRGEVQKTSAAWYRNGNQIADFLSSANPDNWSRDDVRAMMKEHLDQTLTEATAHLEGDYEREIRTYDAIHDHILEMADVLSDGIVAQFPDQFE
jgi:hypothetical protein